MEAMRSYGQYCSVAKALDVIGDRWTLLIVRELLLRGPSRYTDLRRGLPGIATNLLADRLRELEQAGIVLREDAPPPIATALFSLTPRGEQLRPVIDELGRWGIPLMAETTPDEEYRSHWLQLPVDLYLSRLTRASAHNHRSPRRRSTNADRSAGRSHHHPSGSHRAPGRSAERPPTARTRSPHRSAGPERGHRAGAGVRRGVARR